MRITDRRFGNRSVICNNLLSSFSCKTPFFKQWSNKQARLEKTQELTFFCDKLSNDVKILSSTHADVIFRLLLDQKSRLPASSAIFSIPGGIPAADGGTVISIRLSTLASPLEWFGDVRLFNTLSREYLSIVQKYPSTNCSSFLLGPSEIESIHR